MFLIFNIDIQNKGGKDYKQPTCSAWLSSVTNNSSAGIIWNIKFSYSATGQIFSTPIRIFPGRSSSPSNGFQSPSKNITVKVIGPFDHIDLIVGGTTIESIPYDTNTPSGGAGYYDFFIGGCGTGEIIMY